MKILALSRPELANGQAGDYYKVNTGFEYYEIKQNANKDYEKLVFLHEFLELWAAEKAGITEQQITLFDAEHADYIEPAMADGSPYREQHIFAENIERIVAHELGIDFDTYTESL